MKTDKSDLIALIRSNDTAAFKALYDMYRNSLLAYINSLMPDNNDAEEILQDAFMALWDNRCNVRNDISVYPFLKATARNKALNLLRDRRRQPFHDDYSAADGSQDICRLDYSPMEFDDFAKSVKAHIRALPSAQRRILTLSRVDELTHGEICHRLNLSLQTVKNSLSMALRTLREKLAEEGYTVFASGKIGGG